jgi:hypothetical protein
MGSERRSMPEQELSIREREQELFADPQETPTAEPPVKPFPIYLRETPANPMSSEVKVILWIVGIAVLLLFCVALWRTTQRPSRLRRGLETGTQLVIDSSCVPVSASHSDGVRSLIRRADRSLLGSRPLRDEIKVIRQWRDPPMAPEDRP